MSLTLIPMALLAPRPKLARIPWPGSASSLMGVFNCADGSIIRELGIGVWRSPNRTTRYTSLDKSSWWQILLGFLVVRYSFETALTMSKIQSPFVLGRRSGALLTGTISLRSE